MSKSRFATASALVLTVGLASPLVYADDAGAFIGGIFAAKILDNMQRRTRAEEVQAYQSSRSVPSHSASSGGSYQSVEARLKQLDKLAADGYVSPEEYRAKKKAILDSL